MIIYVEETYLANEKHPNIIKRGEVAKEEFIALYGSGEYTQLLERNSTGDAIGQGAFFYAELR